MDREDMILALVFLFLAVSVAAAAFVDSLRLRAMHFSTVNIVVGAAFGGVARLAFTDVDWSSITFDHQIFFKAILPVIVFAAGYSIDLRTFFANSRSIMLLAVVGTIVNWVALALTAVWLNDDLGVGPRIAHVEALLLTACLASTDTVAVIALLDATAAPVLYAVLAGEGIVNDGVSVALYRAVKNVADDPDVSNETGVGGELLGRVMKQFCIVCAGSAAVGVGIGLASALLARWQRERPSAEAEVSLTLLWGFVAYFLAEGFECSGILSLFICGMVMARYLVFNTGRAARFTSYHALNALSYAGMTLIFTSLGFFLWAYFTKERFWGDTSCSRNTFAFAGAVFVAVVVYRVGYVVLLLAVANWGKPAELRLRLRDQLVTIYGGLVRGVIAFALSQDIDTENREDIISVVYIIVIATTVPLGCLTNPVLRCHARAAARAATARGSAAAAESMREASGEAAFALPSGALLPPPGADAPAAAAAAEEAALLPDGDGGAGDAAAKWQNCVVAAFARFDAAVMRPCFGGPPQPPAVASWAADAAAAPPPAPPDDQLRDPFLPS